MGALPRVLCLVLLLSVNEAVDPDRPNFTEWKEGQADASAAKASEIAKEKKMAAVNKVVSLLTDLRSQVLAEGEKEAGTYNKFACFCKDTTAEKNAAIEKGEADKASLAAEIARLDGVRNDLDNTIKTRQDDIAAAEQAMKKAAGARAKALKLYQLNDADLVAALEALTGAIASLKSSKNPSFAQLQAVSKTVRTAALLADALGLEGGKALQEPFAPPTEDYKFHSDGIVETLEKLEKDFRSKKADVDADEVQSVHEHDLFMQAKHDLVKQLNKELDEAKQKRDETVAQLEMNNEQLTTTAAVLLDDKQYLSELAEMCNQKAVTWDQRSRVRKDEIFTLTQVLKIMQAEVTEKTTAATIRFQQEGTSVRLAQAVARDQGSMDALEAEAEAAETQNAPSFLQTKDKKKSTSFLARNLPGLAEGRHKVAELLKKRGGHLKSTLLSALADKIDSSNDPFAKIKILIQELLERLLAEQGHEANQKGWCDKATADATQKRDYAADEIRELNGQMSVLEATRNKLRDEIDILNTEIRKLEDARSEAVRIRGEEKAENANTVAEAQSGMDALDMGIDILTKWYKANAKEKVSYSFVQGPADDAPDQSFKIGEAYTGAQSESGGILGMMAVMKSDFERTISETEAAEAQAEQDHLAFMTETGKSLAQKTEAESLKTHQKDDTEDKLQKATDDLDSQTVILQTAVKELMELKPACIDTGMSYSDRVANREEEIAALKKADCILSAYMQYGPDGAADAC